MYCIVYRTNLPTLVECPLDCTAVAVSMSLFSRVLSRQRANAECRVCLPQALKSADRRSLLSPILRLSIMLGLA
jgi:hypothetical protein